MRNIELLTDTKNPGFAVDALMPLMLPLSTMAAQQCLVLETSFTSANKSDNRFLAGSRSRTLFDVWLRPPEQVIMRRDRKPLTPRVFIDRSVIEVFASGKQYLAMRVDPGREDSVGVSVRAQGQDAVLNSLDAWQTQSVTALGE